MNINITGNRIISTEIIKYNQDNIIKNTNRSTINSKNEDTTNQTSLIDFSEGSVLAYELSNRFKDATGYQVDVKLSKDFLLGKNDYDDSFIKDFAIEYYNIRNELSSKVPKADYKKYMNLVDKVYEDVVNEASESLSRVFENFFDYSSNVSKVYKMKSVDGIFNEKKFENHLISMGKTALNIVKNADINTDINTLTKDIEQNLKKIGGDSLNTMNYKDIQILSKLFKELPSLSLSIGKKTEQNTMNRKEKIWSNAIDNLDDNLSKNVKDAVIKSINKNLKTYNKVGNFINMKENLNNELEKLNKLLSKLIKQRKVMLKQIDKIVETNTSKKDSVIKRTSQLLKQVTNLNNNINTLIERISSIQKNLESLTNNPDEIESNIGKE